MSQDVMLCVMNSTAIFGDSVNLEMKKSESCNKCLDLEAELVKKKNMVERDVYTELSNRFTRLEKHCISLELDIQLNQQFFQKDNSCENQNAPEFLEYLENNDLKAQLQEKDNTINKLRNHIKSLRESDKKDRVKQDVDEIETINIKLEHSVAKLFSENKLLHKEIKHLKKIYKDQFDSIKKTRALSKEHYDSLIAQLNSKSMENADLKGQIKEKVFMTTTLQNELRRLKGVKSSTSASRSQPSGITKNNRILRPTSSNMKNKVEDYPRSVKSKSNKMNHVVKSKVDDHPRSVKSKHLMLNANSELICATCNKCMFDAIHDMCVLDFVKDVNVRSKSRSAKSIKKQNIWKPMGKVFTDVGYRWKPIGRTFTLVEAVATACYTQNRYLIRKHNNKTPYELLHNQKPDLSYLHVFGALCYPTNDNEDLGKLQPKADIGIFIGYAPTKKASELMPNPPSLTPSIPPTKKDWEILFQPMFDEYFSPPTSVVSLVPAAVPPVPTDLTGTPSSTSVEQDAPSPSTLQTPQETQALVLSSGVEEENHDIEVSHME
ncbi:retrovirus-related pol polyprotein from transposon TNT 1-94 [Tanacetum coccineum]